MKEGHMAASTEVVEIESAIDRIIDGNESNEVKQRALTAVLIAIGSAQYNLQKGKE